MCVMYRFNPNYSKIKIMKANIHKNRSLDKIFCIQLYACYSVLYFLFFLRASESLHNAFHIFQFGRMKVFP